MVPITHIQIYMGMTLDRHFAYLRENLFSTDRVYGMLRLLPIRSRTIFVAYQETGNEFFPIYFTESGKEFSQTRNY